MNGQIRLQVLAEARQARRELRKVKAELASLSAAAKGASTGVSAATTRAAASAAKTAATAQTGQARAIHSTATAANTAGMAQRRLAANTAATTKATRAATAAQRSFATSLVNTGKQGQWVGSILTQRLTLPFVALGAVASHWAFEFDASMTRIRKVYNSTLDEMDQTREMELIEQGVLGISNAYGVAADEIADLGARFAQVGVAGPQLLDLVLDPGPPLRQALTPLRDRHVPVMLAMVGDTAAQLLYALQLRPVQK